ncbi:MAG: DNA topoisomerase IB [bacterium]
MKADQLQALYHDSPACAKLVGLTYITDDIPGSTRQKSGTGFSYIDKSGETIHDRQSRKRFKSLAVPPAWESVWFSEDEQGHILVTGLDEKGRKQYMYHPKWRKLRELINFYRLMSFGSLLPKIRRDVDEQLSRPDIDREQLLALMVWFLDNSYIRIGNETYFEENESIGLTSLRKKNVTVMNDVIRLEFMGKSHQDHLIELKNQPVADLITRLMKQPGEKLFQTRRVPLLDPTDCNQYLQTITEEQISAKDFRTWGGTLAAFTHLKKNRVSDEDPDKVVLDAVDQAAEVLGNTRSVARDHYVHPHILDSYSDETFAKYFSKLKPRRVKGLYTSETELLDFLDGLFKTEFDVLAVNQIGAEV